MDYDSFVHFMSLGLGVLFFFLGGGGGHVADRHVSG